MAKQSTLIINGDASGAKKAIDETTSKLSMAEADISKIGTGLSGSLQGFTGLLTNLPFMAAAAGAGLVTGLGKALVDMVKWGDELDKMSQKIGVSTETLSGLKYAADIADVDFQTLTQGIEKFSKNLGDVNAGVGQTAKYGFQALGLSLKDSNGHLKDANTLFLETADRLSTMKDGVQKTWIVMTLFGRAGAELIPFFNQGADGIDKLTAKAKEMGLIIDEKTAKAAAHLNDQMTTMNAQIKGLEESLAGPLLPLFGSFAEGMNNVFSVLKNPSAWSPEGFFAALSIQAQKNAEEMLGAYSGASEAVKKAADNALAYAQGRSKEQLQNDIKRVQGTIDSLSKSPGNADIINQAKAALDVYENVLKSVGKTTNKNKDSISQWAAVNITLGNEIAQKTMPAIDYQLKLLDEKFTDYTSKFPDHIKEIQKWRDIMVKSIYDIDKANSVKPVAKAFEMPGKKSPKELLGIPKKEMDEISQSYVDATGKITMNMGKVWSDYHSTIEQSASDSFSNMASAADNFYQLSGSKNKAAFDLYKAFSIAQALIDTYKTANAAYSAMAAIPLVGPALGIAAAAAAVAFGLSNVARIAAMQPGQAATGGAATSSQSASATIPSQPAAGTTNNNNQRTQFTINFNGDPSTIKNTDKFARNLIASLNKAQKDGIVLNAS